MRFADAAGTVRVGLRDADDGIRELDGVHRVADLLRLPLRQLRERVEQAPKAATHRRPDVTLLPPVDGHTEVWASGVTYERSREARGEESDSGDLYDHVYTATRPELFFKAVSWRVVTHGEPIAIRADSELDVPEPELAVVSNAYGEIVGYAVCNDVSSRSIEGENALYLPQAKVYAGSCALATEITPAWQVGALDDQWVRMSVRRRGMRPFDGEVPLAALRRGPAELVDYLFRGQPFPEGAVLATGTGIVPGMDFTLMAGDTVEIEITEVGTLSNPVVRGVEPMSWLSEARERPAARHPAAPESGPAASRGT
ncbi:2-dehydro-3-deoxy-D-arabinonate dehydratase [Lipingzhangella halophila]|uniref:2-dehydro-3-deoxy-D-arabinonate dehydratase n=1 Tax=Lipingzhangella halophila TaxID=1783352 RepID=A0A7W7W5H7_9ACTN|nr:fumarylacetoacetate hydrolase family protein [Lipingzhangella halophila]MBB4935247.1 2-dehydro-3-deoxy-D-arabinonate dehydratase [Lipingzhangella halophila]